MRAALAERPPPARDTEHIVHDRPPASEFVGRRAELATFERAIADARAGLPSVVLVSGDAGIGKTTMVGESARRAGVRLYLGRSTHIGGDTIPLAPLADLLRQIRRAQPQLMAEASPLAALHDWAARGDVAAREHGGLFVVVLELITQLAAAETVVIGVEDLHWADTVTWDLFDYLARNLIDEHVVLVGTFRANEVAVHPAQRARLAELSRLPASCRIHLEGLGWEEIAQRVALQLGRPAPRELVDQIAARGRGNPFFTSELVGAHLAGEAIPIVLSDLISAEISGLDEVARLVLGAVATIGRDATHELLAAVVGLPDEQLERVLRTVIAARMLVVENDAYRFRHPLLGEVAYADLLPPQRRRLHRSVAAVLHLQPAEALQRADRAGELAFHLDRAGDVQAAFPALLAAADAAETIAPGAAFAHLERAFELWDAAGERSAAEDRARRLWQAADIATSTVGNERAVQLARQAFACGPPPRGAASGHERLGRYLWAIGQLEASRAEFAKAAELLGQEGRAAPAAAAATGAAAAVRAGLGQAALMAGDDESARHWCLQVVDADEAADGDRSAWSMAMRVLGVARSNAGDPQEGITCCRAAVVAAADAQGRALANLYLCVVLVDAGEYQTALDTSLDAVADGQLTGLDRGFGCYFDSLAAEALVRLGRWSEVAGVLARQPVADTLPVGLLRLARSRAMLAARRGEEADATAQLTVADSLPVDGLHQTVRDATLAEVHVALGNWAEAAAAAERGSASAGLTSPLWAARFTMWAVIAAVESTLDRLARREPVDLDGTVAGLAQRIDTVGSMAAALPGGAPRDTAAHLAQSVACLTRLTTSDADAWATAAHCWDALGDRIAAAGALVREAEAAAASGSADRAATALRRAHSIATEVGAEPLLAEVAAVSSRTRISVQEPTRVVVDGDSAERLGLTPREADVLALVAAGRTNRQIGEELYVSDKTASVHVSNILRKLGVSSRVDAAAVAQRLGIA